MIRGNIEIATPELIQGWIHVENDVVRNRVVLAFCNERCVGSGTVNMFREDLAEAGLGDGFLGFVIQVALDEDDAAAVVVRLEGSDAVLLQPGARVANINGGAKKLKRDAVTTQLGSLKWSLKHARISQADFDFQRMLYSLGVYERGLVHRHSGEEELVSEDPVAVLTKLLESYASRELEIETLEIRDEETLKDRLAALVRNSQYVPLIGVHARDVAWFRVLEGSHVAGAPVTLDSAGMPEYAVYTLAAQNVMILDARVVLDLRFPNDLPVDVSLVMATLAN